MGEKNCQKGKKKQTKLWRSCCNKRKFFCSERDKTIMEIKINSSDLFSVFTSTISFGLLATLLFGCELSIGLIVGLTIGEVVLT